MPLARSQRQPARPATPARQGRRRGRDGGGGQKGSRWSRAKRFLFRLGRRLFFWGLVATILGAVLFLGTLRYYSWRAEKYDLERLRLMQNQARVDAALDVDLPTIYGPRPYVVGIDEISPHFIDALLVREDGRFRDHGGVDWLGVVRAMIRNVKDRTMVQGAGTITMQLARNAYDEKARSFDRKLLEAMLARRIEASFSKDEILALYSSWVFLGDQYHGVERASRAWFGKTASDLTLGESATLAGILRAPNRFSPRRRTEKAQIQRDVVLERMAEEGVITESERDAAVAQPLRVLASGTGDWMDLPRGGAFEENKDSENRTPSAGASALELLPRAIPVPDRYRR